MPIPLRLPDHVFSIFAILVPLFAPLALRRQLANAAQSFQQHLGMVPIGSRNIVSAE
jgi:hypothetical protein